jgi:hypothetical protein
LGYNINHNDTANFNIEHDDEEYIREIMQDMKEKSNTRQLRASEPIVPTSSQKKSVPSKRY